MRKLFISRESRQQHTAMPNQCHHITIQEYDQRNNETNTEAIGLHRNARGRNDHIQ